MEPLVLVSAGLVVYFSYRAVLDELQDRRRDRDRSPILTRALCPSHPHPEPLRNALRPARQSGNTPFH